LFFFSHWLLFTVSKLLFWKINGNCLTLKAIDEEESFPGKVLLTEQS
jgi:hypothetical protein